MFTSALEQAEQLMRAAADVGPAARPLPLFYALNQAGRAIAAARLSGDNWRLAGHGLRAPQSGEKDLLRRVVAPQSVKGLTSFAGVAEAVKSDKVTAPIELGAIWAAMPDLIEPMPQMPDLDPARRRPLRAYQAKWADMAMTLPRRPLELLLGGLPVDPDHDAPVNMDELAIELKTHYPAAMGVAIPAWRQGVPVLARQWAPTKESLPAFWWPDVSEPYTELDAIAPNYRGKGVRVLRPRLSTGDFLSPLMLWWLLLFGLSTVARYDPEIWVAALDVNNSPQAVPLEATLDEALDALPELILEALSAD